MCAHAIFQTKTDRPVEDVFCVELRKRRFQEVNETIQFGQSPGISPSTPRKGAIRHYMISWRLGWQSTMNDKGGDGLQLHMPAVFRAFQLDNDQIGALVEAQ